MKPKHLITALITCTLAGSGLQAQFFYPKKCFDPDSIFTELHPGTINAWGSIGFRRERNDGLRQNNWFSNVTINYIPLRGLETGIHFNKPIPRDQPYSYRYSTEYVPYARYTLFSNGCFRYALWADLSYHIDRQRNKEQLISRLDSPAAGFGVYKTAGRFFWLQTHSEFYLNTGIVRHELRLIWKMLSVQGKGSARKTTIQTPVSLSK